MAKYWSDEANAFIECESASFTGPSATHSLIGDGWVQKNGDPLTGRAWNRNEVPSQKSMGVKYYHRILRCQCGMMMSYRAKRCRLCDLAWRRRGMAKPDLSNHRAHCRSCGQRFLVRDLSANRRMCLGCQGKKKAA
jgi:hypothetical protein